MTSRFFYEMGVGSEMRGWGLEDKDVLKYIDDVELERELIGGIYKDFLALMAHLRLNMMTLSWHQPKG